MGRINAFRLLFKASDPGQFKTLASENIGEVVPINITGPLGLYTTYGKVKRIKKNFISINSDPKASDDVKYDRNFYMLDAPKGDYSTSYYIYDTKINKLSEAKRGDIASGDKVFVRDVYYRPIVVYIIR